MSSRGVTKLTPSRRSWSAAAPAAARGERGGGEEAGGNGAGAGDAKGDGALAEAALPAAEGAGEPGAPPAASAAPRRRRRRKSIAAGSGRGLRTEASTDGSHRKPGGCGYVSSWTGCARKSGA